MTLVVVQLEINDAAPAEQGDGHACTCFCATGLIAPGVN
jgi:hypothetical protein